jgi:hypothetical protein
MSPNGGALAEARHGGLTSAPYAQRLPQGQNGGGRQAGRKCGQQTMRKGNADTAPGGGDELVARVGREVRRMGAQSVMTSQAGAARFGLHTCDPARSVVGEWAHESPGLARTGAAPCLR